MKFVTEQQLRSEYNQKPFTSYVPAAGSRLTPEARQFLTDRKIALRQSTDPETVISAVTDKWFGIRLEWLRSLCLIAGEQLLAVDPVMAQKVFALDDQLRNIAAMAAGTEDVLVLELNSCTGITAENHTMDTGDCFTVTAFHAQLPGGRQLLSLHQLRCGLRELNATAQEVFAAGQPELAKRIESGLGQLINRLNQMICLWMGGTSCQR